MSNKAFAEDEVRMMESSRLRKEALEHGNYRSITKLRDSIERKERGQPKTTMSAAAESQDSSNSSTSRRKRDSEMSSRSQNLNFKGDAGSMLSYNPHGKHSEQIHRSTMNIASSDTRRQKSYAGNLHDFNNTQPQMQQSSQRPKEHSLRQRSIPPSSNVRDEKTSNNPRSLQYRLETDAREKERLLRDRGHTSGMTVRSEVSRASEGSFQSTSSKSRTSSKKTDSELITRRPRSSSVVDSDTTRYPNSSGDSSTKDRRRTASVISRRSPHTNRSPVSSTTPPRRTASAVDLPAREKEAMLKLEGTEYKPMYSKVGTSNRVQPLSSTKKISGKMNTNDMVHNFSKTTEVVVSATKAREKRDAFRAQRKSNDAFLDLDGKPLLRNYDNRKASYDLIDVADDKPLHRVDESFKRRTDESTMVNPRQRPVTRSNNNASTTTNSSSNSNNTRSMDLETRTNERFRHPTNHAADTVESIRANPDDRRKANPPVEDRYQRHRTNQNNHVSSSSDMSLRRRPESSNGDNDLRKTEVPSSTSSRRKADMFGTSSNKSRRDMLVRDDSFTIDTLSGSTRSSNPFADAMKAILLDMNSPSGFNSEKEMEQRIADLVLGKLKRHTQRRHDAISEESFQSSTLSFVGGRASGASSGPPRKYATIVLTDVQGSTSLWEANPQAMQEALDLHDKIMRRFCAFHNGYEIDTEGDAFFLAFHNPMDAFGFALDTQSALYDTEWSTDLLAIPAAKEEGSFRGLRVRMGIHHGPVTSCKNEVTGRTEYVGEAMNICKCVEGMTHGGQILTTFETWNVASYKAEADLGSPQVVDIGCHMLSPKGFDEPIARRIIQLVPASLSYDYFAARRLEKSDSQGSSSSVKIGRIFDPPITDEQISASFNDAPFENNEVTIAFVYFSEIDNHFEDPKPVVAALIRLIGELLVGAPGYHSQSNMLAFPNVNEAIKFGLRLMDEVQEFLYDGKVLDLSTMIKMGCVHDTFLTMGPHKTTGRADYFGKVVNRAARITAKSDLGTVNFGVLADDSVANLPKLDHSILAVLRGVKELKGVQEEMALYECRVDHSVPLGLHS